MRLSSGNLIRDAFPFYRMLLERERNVLCNLMYTPPDHGKIYTRATPAPTTRLVWGISLRYTPLAHASYARKKTAEPRRAPTVSRDSTTRMTEFYGPPTSFLSVTPGSFHHRCIQLVMLNSRGCNCWKPRRCFASIEQERNTDCQLDRADEE